ncbi:Pycsar system effector family protein [Devosia sp. XK-2]|uniref:Pycsar system effector family protein n=1 Tax=Devosia sp. XK-2 TaxID=3126689 RepID=UPI0030CD00CA
MLRVTRCDRKQPAFFGDNYLGTASNNRRREASDQHDLSAAEAEKAIAQAEAEAEALRISKATARAELVLSGLLEWVGKTDGRTGFLFAVNTALGGIALTNLASSRWSIFEVLVFFSYFVLFALAAVHLILVQYPNVASPNRSMLFFATIAGNASDDFIERFSSMTDDDYLRDVLHQCHVNSLVVTKKFQRIHKATRYLIASSFLWLLIIAVPTFNGEPARQFLSTVFASPMLGAVTADGPAQ